MKFYRRPELYDIVYTGRNDHNHATILCQDVTVESYLQDIRNYAEENKIFKTNNYVIIPEQKEPVKRERFRFNPKWREWREPIIIPKVPEHKEEKRPAKRLSLYEQLEVEAIAAQSYLRGVMSCGIDIDKLFDQNLKNAIAAAERAINDWNTYKNDAGFI